MEQLENNISIVKFCNGSIGCYFYDKEGVTRNGHFYFQVLSKLEKQRKAVLVAKKKTIATE